MYQKFYEADFYSDYKYVRNKFRKYNSIVLLDEAFKFLYKSYPTKFKEFKNKQPWQVLLLIKWILIDDKFLSTKRNEPSEKDFLKILQSVRNLGGKVRMPDEYDHLRLFFRNMSYQQIMYQQNFNMNAFSRQLILFSDLNDNHSIKSNFRDITGLEVQEFVELSSFLLVRFVKKIKSVKLGWFSPIFPRHEKSKVKSFLNDISLTLDQAREYLLDKSKNRRHSSEIYEQTPLKRYPLLQIGNKYFPYNLNVLFRGLEHFIYDSVREKIQVNS